MDRGAIPRSSTTKAPTPNLKAMLVLFCYTQRMDREPGEQSSSQSERQLTPLTPELRQMFERHTHELLLARVPTRYIQFMNAIADDFAASGGRGDQAMADQRRRALGAEGYFAAYRYGNVVDAEGQNIGEETWLAKIEPENGRLIPESYIYITNTDAMGNKLPLEGLDSGEEVFTPEQQEIMLDLLRDQIAHGYFVAEPSESSEPPEPPEPPAASTE